MVWCPRWVIEIGVMSQCWTSHIPEFNESAWPSVCFAASLHVISEMFARFLCLLCKVVFVQTCVLLSFDCVRAHRAPDWSWHHTEHMDYDGTIPARLIKMINKSCCLASSSHTFQSVHVLRRRTAGMLKETHIHTEYHDRTSSPCYLYNNL